MSAPVLIAGPTASGKSELALRIAERDGGVVINADASQVYDCWRVLTARPGPEDLARAPHRLYGHVHCATRYSVGAWLRDLAPLLAQLRAEGRRAVIAGGTGLYFSALTEGLAEIPEIPSEVRARSLALLAEGRTDVMLADLECEDPVTFARIDRANPMRIQRAWDVLRGTGRGLSDWHSDKTPALLSGPNCVRLCISPEKHILNNNINNRFHKMVYQGALEECADFQAAGHDPMVPSGRALGAAELISHLRGETSLEEAIARATIVTRQFAKRQRSWFRGRMADWLWIDPTRGDPLAAVPRV